MTLTVPTVETREKTVADVLRHAALLMEERGSCEVDWQDDAGRVCTLGALAVVSGYDPMDHGTERGGSRVYGTSAFRFLETFLGTDYVGLWSDAHTHAERIAALRAAADAWETEQ
jgi:hypothetical protein